MKKNFLLGFLFCLSLLLFMGARKGPYDNTWIYTDIKSYSSKFVKQKGFLAAYQDYMESSYKKRGNNFEFLQCVHVPEEGKYYFLGRHRR